MFVGSAWVIMDSQTIELSSELRDVVTSDSVIVFLKEKIKHGNLAPGQRLIEADIVRDTGASRGRVRAALHRLVADGLVVIEEYRGASVKRWSRDEVRHIYSTREVLEGLAVKTVAELGDNTVFDKLRTLQERMNNCEASGNNRQFAKLNEEWHTLLISASNNIYLAEFLDRLRIPTFRLQFQMFFEDQIVMKANADHRGITDAVVSGDGEQAERLMCHHIRSAFLSLNAMDDEFFA